MNKSIVDYALEIATEAHKGQTRWDGTPYIEHPKAVANIAKEIAINRYACLFEFDLDILTIAAFCHDICEDVEEFLNQEEKLVDKIYPNHCYERAALIDALKRLNKNNYKSYLDFILAADGSQFSRFVKIADIKHNLSNLEKGSMKDKYELALYILGD